MERVERYKRKYGPIIKSVKMEIQGCVRPPPPIKRTVPNPKEEAVTTKRTTTDGKPAVKKTKTLDASLLCYHEAIFLSCLHFTRIAQRKDGRGGFMFGYSHKKKKEKKLIIYLIKSGTHSSSLRERAAIKIKA